MPFSGCRKEALAAVNALESIERSPGDELILVDNSRELCGDGLAVAGHLRVVTARREHSSYHARNVGAEAAENDWLLFLDSDCEPVPEILGAYFTPEIDAGVGAVAGEVGAEASQTRLLARYLRDREHLSQRRNLEDPRPYAVTANLLVRSRAWRSVGGFLEGVRSGGDTDFTWRLQEAGWQLDHRPRASVVHRHREDLASFARVTVRYSAGRAWLDRRYPGLAPAAPGRQSALRALAGVLRWTAAGRLERAAFRAVDVLVILLDRLGFAFSNSPPRPGATRRRAEVVVLADTFPEISETFIASEVRALERLGHPTRVEASRRATRQDLLTVRACQVDFREDDPAPAKLIALARLLAAHPLACLADLRDRRRWRREEPVPPLRVLAPMFARLREDGQAHLHAHFAAGAALSALRLARLTGRAYSVTAHAYEIFREPRNLAEKLDRAAFVTTGCRYNVEHLRRIAPGARIHEVVMGVDGERFRRQASYPGKRRLVAVGRLVEKKGFADLIEAMARLEDTAPADRLELVGDGPLRGELQELAARRGVSAKIVFAGALSPDEVRAAIERADLMVMPCVVAADGDRDSMPVVVKEALALEVPVVGTLEVGLPELVQNGWGRLVPPHDPDALAGAIAELLALDPGRRAEMGLAGRAHVLECCSLERETARLAGLIEAQRASQSTSIR